ncbi:hypothetical protein GW17_00062239, partial [Ensete ventricosum]
MGVFGACLVDTLCLRGSWSKHYWFRPVCASTPAVLSVRSWSLAGWVMIQDSAWEVGYWSGGAPIGKKSPSSGRVGSRRDPSDGQVNLVILFFLPLPRKGAGAFIVSVVDHSYMIALLLLWPTMPSYPSITLTVHVVRRAFAGRGVDPTCVRSAVQPLAPPILASGRLPVSGRPRRRASCPKQEPGNFDVARVDPTEQELGNCNVARVDPTEQELGNCDVARVDPTEQELGNCNVARVDPTEQELGNCDVARVDPTEQELGN